MTEDIDWQYEFECCSERYRGLKEDNDSLKQELEASHSDQHVLDEGNIRLNVKYLELKAAADEMVSYLEGRLCLWMEEYRVSKKCGCDRCMLIKNYRSKYGEDK